MGEVFTIGCPRCNNRAVINLAVLLDNGNLYMMGTCKRCGEMYGSGFQINAQIEIDMDVWLEAAKNGLPVFGVEDDDDSEE